MQKMGGTRRRIVYTAGSCMLILILTGLSIGVISAASSSGRNLNQVKNQKSSSSSSDDVEEAYVVDVGEEDVNNPLYERFTDQIFRQVREREQELVELFHNC